MTAVAEKIAAAVAAVAECEQAIAQLQRVGRGGSLDAVAGAAAAGIAAGENRPSCCVSAHQSQVHDRQKRLVDGAAVVAVAPAAVPEIWHAI